MVGVWYAAVAVVLVLGLLFIRAYSARTRGGNGRHSGNAEPGTQTDQAAAATQREAASAKPSAKAVPAASAAPTASTEVEPRSEHPDAAIEQAKTQARVLREAAEAEAEATLRAARAKAQSLAVEAHATRTRADAEAANILAEARSNAQQEITRLTAEVRRAEAELAEQVRRSEQAEQRLEAEERRLSAEAGELDQSLVQLNARRREVDAAQADLDQRRAELDELAAALDQRAGEFDRELERVAGLSAEEAKAELMSTVEASSRREAALLVRSIENEARSEGTNRAREIVVEAVQRVASEQTSETVVSVMHLPSDEMKGRIIGREGRNIRAYESVTGVNLIIDDTPEAVLLSCFDPVRREVGRLTLERLVLDGRIHPHRIEEAYELSLAEVEDYCLRAARDALADVGITDLDDRLLPTLGRLKYRTSYGQNVLGHLIETAHIAGVMAAELGIEPTLIKRCAFLHDIGKALTHEVEGSHAIVGAELLRKYGEDEAVAHAVEAHHNEVQPRTVEAVLTQAADACSAARPGARRESLEAYVKRLARIEEIANAKAGVEKVFAMQSGREVRVMVQPSEVDDLAASVLAREIAKQIEDELTYPGQIRVTVVRESRATEIAH
jgi:ribonuclease Y